MPIEARDESHRETNSAIILDGPEVKVSKIYIHDQGSVHLHLICQVSLNLDFLLFASGCYHFCFALGISKLLEKIFIVPIKNDFILVSWLGLCDFI